MQLIQWDKIRTAIETTKDIETLTKIKDRLRAYQILADQSKQSQEVQAKIAIYKARADRKCGEWLTDNIKAGNPQLSQHSTIGLKEVKLTRSESSRLQKIAAIPEDKFEGILQEAEVETRKITSNMLVKIAKEADRSERRRNLKTPELPKGIFNVIYADPPWEYEHCESNTREIENQYPTMKLEDIQKLKLPTDRNSILFLWATAPKLEEAISVLNAWGFVYRTCAVWDKEIIGMGYWFRGQHELLLVGVKGEIATPDPAARISSVYREKRTRHSKKPDYYYEIIEKYFPHGKYLEVFARNNRKGWGSWGNEL